MADTAVVAAAPDTTSGDTGGSADVGGWPTTQIFKDPPRAGQSDDATDTAPTDVAPDEPWLPDESTSTRKTRLKVDGKEYETTVGELHKYAQLGIAANSRMQEASKIKADYEGRSAMLDDLMTDPSRMFQEMVGADEDSAMRYIDALAKYAVERMNMSPEQRKLTQFERDAADRARREQEQSTQQAAQSMNRAWKKTLQIAQLPEGPVGEMVAQAMRQRVADARREGRNETPQSLAAYGQSRLAAAQDAWRKSLSPADRASLVTPADVQARAKASVSRPLVPTAPTVQSRGNNGQRAPQKARTYDPFAI